jgi:hypothetical protein
MKTHQQGSPGTAKSNRLWPAQPPESRLLVLVRRAPLTCLRSLTGISTRTP